MSLLASDQHVVTPPQCWHTSVTNCCVGCVLITCDLIGEIGLLVVCKGIIARTSFKRWLSSLVWLLVIGISERVLRCINIIKVGGTISQGFDKVTNLVVLAAPVVTVYSVLLYGIYGPYECSLS